MADIMRQFLTLLFVLACGSIAKAQFTDNHAIYMTVESGAGNYFSSNLNLNYVYKENYSLKIGYTGSVRKAVSQPDDYSGGLIKSVFLSGLSNPKDMLKSYHLSLGKIVNLDKSRNIRLNLLFGVGHTTITEPENWKKTNNSLIEDMVTDNYTWDYADSHGISYIINPKIEFPFTRYIGLTVSPMVQINKERTYFGVGAGVMLGLLKRKNR